MKIKKQKRMPRGAGVLLPVSSLPSNYGIGSLGDAAHKFIDFLVASKQKYWQVLPIGSTSYGDSPYQSFSSIAGNPYFIDLDILVSEGLLKKEQITGFVWGNNPEEINYSIIYNNRFKILRKAYQNSNHLKAMDYLVFCAENPWLEDYSLFMALKIHFDGVEWLKWPEAFRMRDPEMLNEYKEQFKDEINFWCFCQYHFFKQWNYLKDYAYEKKIQIIGDIPIYVAMDSADVWVNPELFQLDENRFPTDVAGVPPDMFSADGQLWGNPLYNWDKMKEDDYQWWKNRIKASVKLYDVIRIDHFIGIVNYFSIPAGAKTAKYGEWVKGPGEDLVAAIQSVLGETKIIAEDLGVLTSEVTKLVEKSGFPGMKLLTFAFDSDNRNTALPFHYNHNSVVYGGTHDNEPLVSFFDHQPKKVITYAKKYLNVSSAKKIPPALMREAYACCADTVILQIQDILGYGSNSRINTPSTICENWRWRLTPDALTDETAQYLSQMVTTFGR